MSTASTTSPAVTRESEQQAPMPSNDAADEAICVALPLLLATDACCQLGHVTAEVERGGGETPILACVTCTMWWGYREGLRGWAERCSDSFSQVFPHGLAEFDHEITAQPTA